MVPVPNRVKSQKKQNKSIIEGASKIEQFVTFWGVRGTIPIPNENMLKYGGNTSCVEVLAIASEKNNSIILDAGTGIIQCAENALLRGDRIFHLFLTHMHYDHIIGLTKFIPFFRQDCEIHIYGQAKFGNSLKEILQKFFSAPFFPIEFFQLPALKNIFFHELNSLKIIQIENIKIEIQSLNHPQEALAYKIWSPDGKSNIVYATDHEHGTHKDVELEKFIRGCDLFIYDSTYSDSNYKNYIGWGHSTAKAGATIAKNGEVKYYAIFHHEPESSDEYLETKILQEAQSVFKNSFLAAEYQTINISELNALLTDK
ncbi:MBL fold metallo-hydrolase [Silvanigrella aquatica]|uniref:Metallo-beta-lactamase domain-containing protein n=1 Tax=Silvanigrella aquatica TaxID=1915309 RepID=A0A1L4CX04_9BACT|nr:MBL fold metallo-hydrolase [Silvanigrella aquatica]APJ02478.1 hypothetical protein AXG55_00425 [Silvanigrella aquatica]